MTDYFSLSLPDDDIRAIALYLVSFQAPASEAEAQVAACWFPPEGHLGLRPEDLVLSEAGCLSGQVRLIEHLGEVQLLHMTGAVDFIAKVSGQVRIAEGQTCRFDPAPGALHLFDAETEESLLI